MAVASRTRECCPEVQFAMDAAKWVGAEIIAVGISKQLAAIEACETIANEQGFLQIMGHEHRTDSACR